MRLRALERRQQILRVSHEFFAGRGFAGTTTRAIAQRAGISEAMLFRHFPNKKELYWAVLTESRKASRPTERLHSIIANHKDDLPLFAAIALDALSRNSENPSTSRLLLFSALESHDLSDRFFRTFIMQYNDAVAGLVRERIEQGKFREMDPYLAARSLLGMCFHHFVVQELLGGRKYRRYELREVADAFAELWVNGMLKQPAWMGNKDPVLLAGRVNGRAKSNGKHRELPSRRARSRKIKKEDRVVHAVA